MADAKAQDFKKWLFRECCNTVVEVNKKYGALEQFACKCGKKVMGEKLKYYDKKEDAEKAKAVKMGDVGGMPDLSKMM
jgi:hypothetical protein